MHKSFYNKLFICAFFIVGSIHVRAQLINKTGWSLIGFRHPATYALYSKPSQSTPTNKNVSFLHPAYYCSQLGFVCKHEINMDHSLHFPIRFRLGTYDYTQSLEGKH
jgi:hypothetical protein